MATRDGVDVASFQGKPATWQAAAGGIGWAAVKLTELSPRGYIDPDAAADWKWLKDAGKGRIGYLFGHPDVAPTATVGYFIAELGRLGLSDDDAVALDIEVANGRTPAQVAAWNREVLASLRTHLQRVPLLYTFLSFAEAGNCDGCGGYPLWMSDPSSPAGHPRVPRPWSTWAIHQYSAGGAVDRDLMTYPDLPAMRAALGKAKPAPTEDDHMLDGILLTTGPTPVRACEGRPFSQLLLSVADGTATEKLTVSVRDEAGTYTADVTVSWETPGVVHFRHPGKVKALSVSKPAGPGAVAWLLL
jgi:lysozyme